MYASSEHTCLHETDMCIDFYPNDDISVARRARIHKVIQLGAAWVTSWRYDINYIMVDEPHYTYMQVLKHLNQPGLPVSSPILIQLCNADPFIAKCASGEV
jgi:DNA polymerase IV